MLNFKVYYVKWAMEFFYSFVKYLSITSPYLLFGFFIAGIINAFVSMDYVKKTLGHNGFWTIAKAALWGVPLPLCSCSVIPTAVTLKKGGATNATTSAFLISTPESGIDSMAITYSLMDLPMTIIRPISAFVTAFVAGIFQQIFNNAPAEKEKKEEEQKGKSECGGSCSCSSALLPKKILFFDKIKSIFTFAYGTLMDDMADWLFVGLIFGALIDYFVPISLITSFNGFWGRIAVLLIGIPLYVCASASTPIAAAFMFKGMSPGTAIIFLLAGPATNISNLVVMQKYIGKKGVAINVITIAVVSLLISFVVDFLYEIFHWSSNYNILNYTEMNKGNFSFLDIVWAIILFILLVKGIYISRIKKFFHEDKELHDHEKMTDVEKGDCH